MKRRKSESCGILTLTGMKDNGIHVIVRLCDHLTWYVKIMKRNAAIYIKAFALYGVLLALLHFSSIQHDEVSSDAGVDLLAQESTDKFPADIDSILSRQDSYDQVAQLSLLRKAQEIERSFNINPYSFFKDTDRRREVLKAIDRIQDERFNLFDYIKRVKWEGSYSHAKRKGQIVEHFTPAIPRRKLMALRYRSQVLGNSIKMLDAILKHCHDYDQNPEFYTKRLKQLEGKREFSFNQPIGTFL